MVSSKTCHKRRMQQQRVGLVTSSVRTEASTSSTLPHDVTCGGSCGGSCGGAADHDESSWIGRMDMPQPQPQPLSDDVAAAAAAAASCCPRRRQCAVGSSETETEERCRTTRPSSSVGGRRQCRLGHWSLVASSSRSIVLLSSTLCWVTTIIIKGALGFNLPGGPSTGGALLLSRSSRQSLLVRGVATSPPPMLDAPWARTPELEQPRSLSKKRASVDTASASNRILPLKTKLLPRGGRREAATLTKADQGGSGNGNGGTSNGERRNRVNLNKAGKRRLMRSRPELASRRAGTATRTVPTGDEGSDDDGGDLRVLPLAEVAAAARQSYLRASVDGNNGAEDDENRRRLSNQKFYSRSSTIPQSLVQFVDEIHRETTLLTPHEERELGRKVQLAVRVQGRLDELRVLLVREPTLEEWRDACVSSGVLVGDDEHRDPTVILEDGIQAKNGLVVANLRMVQRVVNVYIRNGLGSEYNAGDLMQEGILALIRAAEKFEPDRGFRFSTYAMYWIRASVKRGQILQSSPIVVPQRMHENYKRVQRATGALRQALGRKPTTREVADDVGLSVLQVERCISAMEQQCFSLDAEVRNRKKSGGSSMGGGSRRSDSSTMYDLVQSKADDGEDVLLERLFLKDDLIRSMRKVLSPHEVDLLLLRFGLMDERTLPHGFAGPLTIGEVSQLVGLKPDKVRRLINHSLRQLKHLIAHEWEP